MKLSGKAKMLRIHFGEDDKWNAALPATAGTGLLTDALSETPFRVLRHEEPWQLPGIRRAAVSSFGFGGNNAHLLIEEYVPGIAFRAPSVRRQKVAVVSLAVQAADGAGTEDFISDLMSSRRVAGGGASEIRLPSAGLVFPPRDLERALAQQTLLLQVAGRAISRTKRLPEHTSVLVGMGCDAEATRPVIRLAVRDLLPPDAGVAQWENAIDGPMDAARVVGCMPNITANRLNRQFSLTGPSLVVGAEELSGVRALEIAIRELETGAIESAVVGAVDLCAEPVHRSVTEERPGDAACVLVLKRLDDAVRDGEFVLAMVESGGRHAATMDGSALGERVRECFGKAHAAAGLLNVAAAILAIERAVLPGAVPLLPAAGLHRIGVAGESMGGQSVEIQVVEPDMDAATPMRGTLPADAPDVFLYSGRDAADLLSALSGAETSSEGHCRLAIVATERELPERIAQATAILNHGPIPKALPDGIFFFPEKFAGQVGFVFTGAAAAYSGAGRDLLLAMPELSQGVGRSQKVDVARYAGWIYGAVKEPSDFERLCGSSFLCQVHAGFTSRVLGVRPDAAIGLSSGETNALFALGAWSGMGEFLEAIEECGLYTRLLAGRRDTIGGGPWTHYWIAAPREEALEAIGAESSVFITIVNAPDDLIIGGDPSACERVARRFGAHRSARLPMELAVHCPALQPVAGTWRRLHTRPTVQPSGIRFYTNALGASYELTPESVAEALTGQALATVDFPRTILAAWDDGVRIFVEHGPRNQCSQSIRAILGGRPHLAVSLDAPQRSSLRQALCAAAELWCAGVAADIGRLRARLQPLRSKDPPRTGPALVFPAHPPLSHPTPANSPEEPVFVMPPAPSLAPLLDHRPVAETGRNTMTIPGGALYRTVTAMHARMSESHQLYLAEMARLEQAFLAAQQRLLAQSLPAPDLTVSPRRFSRGELEQLASGPISEVFGPAFRGQDGFAHQVRMPEPPLLLADRVIELTGEPNSMGLGAIVTETGVTPGAWYLHQGYMPAGLAVEAGQADLLLISWLGIDRLNQGQRVYRLLGCDLTFHGGLPKAGETLRYEIHVDGHTRHDAVRMFSFHYDCHADGKPRLTVRRAQAGFFTADELANSTGVLWSPESAAPTPQARMAEPPRRVERRAFDRAQVEAFAGGRAADCFGEAFARAWVHTRSPRIPGGRLLLLQTVPVFDPSGGPWRRGYLRAEWVVSPDDWFFQGHFKNDPCMPGTLMFEGCLQAMAFYLAALGFTLERDGWRFEPVPDESYPLRCRGQVVPTSKLLVYEVFVDEIIAAPQPVLYADVLCTVDGLKAFHCRRLALRLVPDWPLEEQRAELLSFVEPKPVAVMDGFAYGHHSLQSCALGRPTDAFGPTFARFNGPLRTPRLAAPPYHFMTRVTRAERGRHGPAGSNADIEYDIPPDAWYFRENGSRTMPPSVLIEHLLQPCGWLASFAGTWLDAGEDVFFRNLDGAGTILAAVRPESRCLKTSIEMKSFAEVAGISIFSFEIRSLAGEIPVFEGTAVFGNFNSAALEQQAGLPAAAGEQEWFHAPGQAEIPLHAAPGAPALAAGRLQMIDRITGYWPSGGAAALGRIRAEKDVDPRNWFFKAHFFNDPVQPGSLGIEAMVQALEALMIASNLHAGIPDPRFESIAIQEPVSWTFRGQVLPQTRLVTVLVEILEARPGFARV